MKNRINDSLLLYGNQFLKKTSTLYLNIIISLLAVFFAFQAFVPQYALFFNTLCRVFDISTSKTLSSVMLFLSAYTLLVSAVMWFLYIQALNGSSIKCIKAVIFILRFISTLKIIVVTGMLLAISALIIFFDIGGVELSENILNKGELMERYLRPTIATIGLILLFILFYSILQLSLLKSFGRYNKKGKPSVIACKGFLMFSILATIMSVVSVICIIFAVVEIFSGDTKMYRYIIEFGGFGVLVCAYYVMCCIISGSYIRYINRLNTI